MNYTNIKPPPRALINPLHPLTNGLVGCWLINEGSGSNIYDISGKNNHGIINGASWTGSKHGRGLNLSGGTDYVNCGNNDSLNITQITIEVLMYPFGTTGTYQFVIDKFYDTGFGLSITSGGGIRPFFNINGTLRYITSTENIKWGKWNHIITTHDGTAWMIYLNGHNVQKSTAYPGVIGTNNNNLRFGQYTVGGYSYNGLIDHVRIYNHSLLTIMAKQLYYNQFTGLGDLNGY